MKISKLKLSLTKAGATNNDSIMNLGDNRNGVLLT